MRVERVAAFCDGERGGNPAGVALCAVLPPTEKMQTIAASSRPAPAALVDEALRLFSYRSDDIDPQIPPAIANAGNDHLILAVRTRELLSRMTYELAAGRELMLAADITTISFVFAETPQSCPRASVSNYRFSRSEAFS